MRIAERKEAMALSKSSLATYSCPDKVYAYANVGSSWIDLLNTFSPSNKIYYSINKTKQTSKNKNKKRKKEKDILIAWSWSFMRENVFPTAHHVLGSNLSTSTNFCPKHAKSSCLLRCHKTVEYIWIVK